MARVPRMAAACGFRVGRVGLGLALLVGVGGCGGIPAVQDLGVAVVPSRSRSELVEPVKLDAQPAALQAFRDCPEFVAHMRSAAWARIDNDGLHLNEGQNLVELSSDTAGSVFGPAVGRSLAGPAPTDPSASSPSVQHFSAPAGAQRVASDGRLLVTARLGRLQVVDVSTGVPRPLAHLDLDVMERRSPFVVLAGTRVLVLDPADDPRIHRVPSSRAEPYVRVRRTVMSVVDLSNPARPRVVGTESVTGRLVAVRGAGGLARVVIVTDPEDRPAGAYRQDPAAARVAVAHAPVGDWLPDRQTRDPKGKVTSGPLMDCAAIRRPPADSGLDVLSVLTVDLADGRPFDAFGTTGVLGSGDLAAASAERLVVATVAGWVDQNRSGNRKLEPAHPRTLLHVFDLAVRGTPRYVTSGALPGYVAGPGALSVRGRDVRAVFSEFPPWDAPRNATKRHEDARVVVLAERGGVLRRVGTVAHLVGGRPLKLIRWTDDMVAFASVPEGVARYYPNPDGGRMDLVALPAGGGPRLLTHLEIPQRTAMLFGAGGGLLVAAGLRAGADRAESLEVATADLATPRKPRIADAVSYGRAEIFAGGATWLPGQRVLVLTGYIAARTRCPKEVRCANATLREDAGAVLLRVGVDGALHPAGWLEPHVQGTPLDFLDLGDRLAAVGDRLTLLDARTLRPIGAVDLPFRQE